VARDDGFAANPVSEANFNRSGQGASVSMLRFSQRLPELGTAIETFIDEVDLGRVPMRLDLAHIHGQQSHATRADLRRHLGVMLDVVMLNEGWHVGSPSAAKSTMNHNHCVRLADGVRRGD
jgi:predicted TIM-barrel enzyme